MIRVASLFVLTVSLTACMSMPRDGYYTYRLQEVERPADSSVRYGQYKIATAQVADTVKSVFEDEMVKITWFPTDRFLGFVLENKTPHTIKIIWDDAAFTDASGKAYRMMHSGVRYSDRNGSQPASVVPRGGQLEDVIVSVGQIHESTAGWEERPLFPTHGRSVEELNAVATAQIGKTFKALVPLQIQDVINEYTFTFKVEGFQLLAVPDPITGKIKK